MGIRKLGRQVFPGISARLITSFSLIFAAMVFIIGWVSLQGVPFTSNEGRIENQREEIFKDLTLVADNKKERLLRWIDERRGNTLVTAGNTSIVSGAVYLRQRVYELTEAYEPELWSLLSRDETYLDLAGYLHTIRDAYGYYDNIQIADAETGIVFVSTDNSTLGTDLSNEPFLINALLTRIVYISDITAQSEDRQPALHFSHLVSDGQGGAAGVLVMRVEAGVIMKSILQAGPFLGESGEALLVNRNNEILTPLKYPLTDGTAAKTMQYKIKSLPAKLASRGEEGIIETLDYRGEKVLAAYRHISLSADWGWGMVVKLDKAELFAPIRQEINNALIIGLVGVVVLIVLTILIAQSITSPIRSLKATAERITGGDLGARAEIMSSDEVGMLARAFNQMTESLVKAKTGLEEEVRERTRELEIEVAERRRLEKEMRLERDNLFNILAAMEDGVYIVNKEFDIQYVNPVLQKDYGPFEGRKCFEYFHDLKELCPWCKNHDVFAGKTVQWEWFSDKNGRTYDLIDTPLKNLDGSISKLEIFRDITERKKAEEALRESETMFKGIFSQAPVGIELYDSKGNLIDANQECLNIFGVAYVEEIKGFKLFEDPNVSAEAKTRLRNGETVDYEAEFDFEAVKKLKLYKTTRSGKCSLHVQITPYELSDRDEKGFVVHIQDITERRRAEEELEKHREHLEEIVKERTVDLEEANIRLREFDRLKSMFIASMSHELRTPLNSIIGFTGIILQGMSGDITGEQRKQLTMVKSSADHLLALINDVIDVSKIEAGKVALSIERFDLPVLLHEVKSAFTPDAEQKGIILSLETPGGLSIRSDERRTKQVIMNLVGNAVKFTDSGKIEIKAARGDGVVEVSVRDTGIGIAREDLERLFKAFGRIRAKEMPIKEGTGLGLYLSQKIADLLGGSIRAESDFGRGSEFTFTLPFEYKGMA